MVLWQWIALLLQIAAIFAIGTMVDQVISHNITQNKMMYTCLTLIMAVIIRFVCDQMATRASILTSTIRE